MKTIYHIDTGAKQVDHEVDANAAVSGHPDEWSFEPWKQEDVAAARAAREAKYKEDYQRAEAAGQPPPPPLPLPVELSDEQQQMLDDDAKNRAEAAARVKVRKEADEKKRVEDELYKADLALLASPPPQVDPNERRPFGRKGAMTPAERAAADKKAAAARAVADREDRAATKGDATAKAQAAADKAERDR